MSPKVILICAISLLAPAGFVVLQNPELLSEKWKVDKSSGHLIYFTLPAG